MGYLPQLSEIDRERDIVRGFKGLNHNNVIDDGQFYEMQNLSADLYPVLTTRQPRRLVKRVEGARSMAAGEYMAWVSGDKQYSFYYNGEQKFECERPNSIVRMGAYFCLFPEGIVYNSQDDTVSYISVTRTSAGQDGDGTYVFFAPTIYEIQADGSKKWIRLSSDEITMHNIAPTDTSKYWLDTSNNPVVLKKYSDAFQMWVSIPTMYGAIYFLTASIPDMTEVFSAGDAITLSGFETSEHTAFLDGSYVLEDIFIDNAMTFLIVAVASYPETIGAYDKITPVFTREMPEMDYVCECGNRLFGCSSKNHEIYASKLGDPLNWNVFSGISTDSYAATVGTAGDFTGIASYRNNVLFFKENRIHILSGTRPANFQIDTIECRGMQRMSSKSAVIANETLFYKSDGGIMAYTGNVPELISQELGEYNKGHVLSAGTDGQKYYCCLMAGDNDAHIMTYDTQYGIWSREDNALAIDFTAIGNSLYMMTEDGGIYDLQTGSTYVEGAAWMETPYTEESGIPWYAITGAIGLDSPYEKYIASIMLRVQMDRNTSIRIETSYDEEDNFTEVGRITADRLRSVTLKIIPRRCDTMRIRLSGTGAFKLYSIAKETEIGGESGGGI